MISEFDEACARIWPPCGISGRRIGTSSDALTCLTGTICVMGSSAERSRSAGVATASVCASASGRILTMLPDGTAAKPCTCSTERNTS